MTRIEINKKGRENKEIKRQGTTSENQSKKSN